MAIFIPHIKGCEENGNIYTYKDGSSTVTSGVKLMTVNTNLNSNYQLN